METPLLLCVRVMPYQLSARKSGWMRRSNKGDDTPKCASRKALVAAAEAEEAEGDDEGE